VRPGTKAVVKWLRCITGLELATFAERESQGRNLHCGNSPGVAGASTASGASTLFALETRPGTRARDAVHIACTLLAMIALVASAILTPAPMAALPAHSQAAEDGEHALDQDAARRAAVLERVRYRGNESLLAAYVGAPYTYPSDLRIDRKATNMTVHGVDWKGKPFDDPIYYGVRAVRWHPQSSFGTMLDFMHSKAYAPLDQRVELSGTKDGKPLPPTATIDDLFHHLEFTHGHNLLTLNLLRRLPSLGSMFSPYVGAGLGVALPHTEVQMKGIRGRTYAYQYAGPAAQFVIGVEIRVPRLSYFIEYKFTSANYRVPLPNFDGGWLPFDLWKQFKAWATGEQHDGWASTWLTSHQVISGMGVRTVPAALPR
jgi:lipid A oxidase